jgi:hypothetical protein
LALSIGGKAAVFALRIAPRAAGFTIPNEQKSLRATLQARTHKAEETKRASAIA